MATSSDRFIPNISLHARGKRLVARPIQLTIGRAVLRLLLAISADFTQTSTPPMVES